MSSVNKASKKGTKKCKHCKKDVVLKSVDCEICNSSYHPSCAVQAGVADSDLIAKCCVSKKSGVKSAEMNEEKLKSVVKELFNEHLNPFKKNIETEFKDIKKSLQFMSDSFDEQKIYIDKMIIEMKLLKEKNANLEQKVQVLEDRINIKEQKEKENNLIVVGIPKQNEEPKKIIERVLKKIKIKIADGDILEVHRINKKEDAPILVKLKKPEIKQDVYRTVRQLKGVKVRECELEGENKNIFFNDDLTKQNQILFKLTRQFKQAHGLRAAYVSNGKIYLKKNENEPATRIRSDTDLQV